MGDDFLKLDLCSAVECCVWLLPGATGARDCAMQNCVSLRQHAELPGLHCSTWRGSSSQQHGSAACLAWPHLPCRCCPCSLCTTDLAWLAMSAVE